MLWRGQGQLELGAERGVDVGEDDVVASLDEAGGVGGSNSTCCAGYYGESFVDGHSWKEKD